ncbi:Matrixin [Pseudobythopirellula maris]|uniref:Matrixin n=1 Tax=Pseudobythopirellula maris TaxID=2527991 RepID=A0A5C5ZKX8_9BACT|nr:matrixin family metalloprotease [Pseudobythopirellula maris]TWT87461.1 Matrixin [Pseudobythopirellula maris]
MSHVGRFFRWSVVFAAVAMLGADRAAACQWCAALGGDTAALCGASDSPDAAASDELPPGAAAYTLQGGQLPQPGGDGTPVHVTFSYNNFLSGGLKDPAGLTVPAWYIRTVVEEAFSLWASVAPLHFTEVPDVGTPVYTSNNASYSSYSANDFGVIRLNHRFINGTDAQNGMPAAKALAYFPSNGPHIAGDIHFDNGDPWAIHGTPSEPDILGILTHEIGHTLGIGHTSIVGTVMNPAALRRNGPGTGYLHPDDIAAVRAIYGAGVGSVTTLVYVPEPSAALLVGLAVLGIISTPRHRHPRVRIACRSSLASFS